ncbi:hypothetical protein FXE34_02890 [Vibrio cholerae]|uniref:Uncharacterized protein n=1 Tax=Vibrio paracholerae TaxID=650003 RepID=A0ABD7FTT5_9VIBR|nr:hypothetical protein DLR72_13095 [Vibrio paracholerae]TXX47569.1 hypothetical protein FXF14_12010 [Vibrio cholerae]TYA09398.1 hypothetical protein FXE34_02890 [Vibrio cholerae]
MGCQLSHYLKSISYRNNPINKAKSCPTLSKILLGGQKVTSLGSRDLWQRSRIQKDQLTT